MCALPKDAFAAPLKVSTLPTAVAIAADVPVIIMSFVTVTVPFVSPAIVLISVAAISASSASPRVTFPVYVSANVPSNAALTSAVEPDKSTE